MSPSIQRPWQVYALTALWAIKGAEELLRGVIGTSFYVSDRVARGLLQGYGLHVALQSILLSAVLAVGSFGVMVALWLGKREARPWGIALAMVSELSVLAYLISRPPEFGGDVALVRTVVIASIVNLSLMAFLLFDIRLAEFLGSPRLTGWWAPRRRVRAPHRDDTKEST
ncbi:MAG: hypothetical protein ACRENN_00195 [Candidatus Eiseniibacteriota bacterium]